MLGEISFAGKKGYNIKCQDTKRRILDEVETRYKARIIQRHHDKFTEAHVPKLEANPHLVGVRTNGNPYLLYLTRLNFVNQCVFIDKKIQQGYCLPRMIVSRFCFGDELFEGTLMSGEMVVDRDGAWTFVLSDIIAHRGMYLEAVNAVKRINLIYHILATQFRPDILDACAIQVKRYFTYGDMGHMLREFVPRLKYTCRGIYFKPLFLRFNDILVNFDDTLVKKVVRTKYGADCHFLENRDMERLTGDDSYDSHRMFESDVRHGQGQGYDDVDETTKPKEIKEFEEFKEFKVFMARKTSMPDVYMLADPDSGHEAAACVSSLATSKLMRGLFVNKNVSDRAAVKCAFSADFRRWIPVEVA